MITELRTYQISIQMRQELLNRMFKITGIKQSCDDIRALTIKDGEKRFTSIVFNTKNIDRMCITKLYSLIFNDDYSCNFNRSKNYIKLRKRFHLEKDETLITVCSYLMADGITDELVLLNKLLIYLEKMQ